MMQLIPCENYREMSTRAADLVQQDLELKPGLLLCAATGNSPAGLYEDMGRRSQSNPGLYGRIRILKLDEWGGIPENHPVSCEYFIRKKLLEPLAVTEDRFLTFRSDPEDPREECRILRNKLGDEGPIDLCILGLGRNGHLGLNEPSDALEPFCHVADLREESLQHEMIASLEVKPTYGITLGMEEILSSARIVLLVTGKGKKEVYSKLMEGKITTALPASFLWTHGAVSCFVDEQSLR